MLKVYLHEFCKVVTSAPIPQANIEEEYQNLVDKHSQTLITRHKMDRYIMTRFPHDLEAYFRSGEAERKGLPFVAYFAEKVFLSPGYFGYLIRRSA